MEKKDKKHRQLTGIVISDKMQKTRVVKVDRTKLNKKYLKRYVVTTRFKAHDEKNEYRIGDKVVIQETRPLSKDKRWIIMGKTL